MTPMTIMAMQQVAIMASAILSKNEGNESEIKALTVRADRLNHAVDFWNHWMIAGLILAAIAAVLIVLATRLVVLRTKQLAVAQAQLESAKDRQLNADLKDKDLEIQGLKTAAETAAKDIGTAKADVAKAEARSAEADAKAEQFRLAIAQANQQAAEANGIAEQERLARLRLEASLADRVLTPDTQGQLASMAKEFPGAIRLDVCVFGGTLEVANIAQAIIGPLSGWMIQQWQVTGGASARGILIGTSPSATDKDREAARQLIAILNLAGIDAGNWGYDELKKAADSGMRTGPPGAVDAPILMVVGPKR
jgi:hypothetical protein